MAYDPRTTEVHVAQRPTVTEGHLAIMPPALADVADAIHRPRATEEQIEGARMAVQATMGDAEAKLFEQKVNQIVDIADRS